MATQLGEAGFVFLAIVEFCTIGVWFSRLVERPTSLYGCRVTFIYFSGGGICVRCLVIVADFWCFIAFNTPCAG